MMTGPPVPARVVPFQRSFLFAVALKHGGIHVQGVALRAYRQSLHLPLGHRLEEALNLAHAELPEQIADRVVGGETLHAQQRMQRLVAAQQTGVSEALGAYQHGHQERHPRGRWLNVVRRIPLDGEVTANLLRQTNLLQIRDEDRDPTEGGQRSLGLTQNRPLAREQSSDFLRNRFVRGVCFHSPLSQAFTLRVQFSFGIQDYGALLHIFESVCSPPPPKTKAGKNGVGKTGSTFDSAFPPEALPEVLKVASELADSFHVAA